MMAWLKGVGTKKVLCQEIHEKSPQRHYHLLCVHIWSIWIFYSSPWLEFGFCVSTLDRREREKRRKYIEIRWHFMLAKGKFNQWLLPRSFSFFIFISSACRKNKRRKKSSKSNIKRKRIIRGSSNGVESPDG